MKAVILLSALVALSAGAPAIEQYAPGWTSWDDSSVGLVAPAPYSNSRSGESEQAVPSMVNVFLMTDPEMAGKAVEAVLRTEDKILQERSLNTEAAASENVKRQVPLDITKISLTTEESPDGSDYNIVPQNSDSTVVDEEAEKLKQMTPPSVDSANIVPEGGFNSDYKPEEVVEAKSSDNNAAAAAVAPSDFKVTKDTIFEPKDPSFSYDNGPNHSGIDISKISLTSEAPEVKEAAPAAQDTSSSYSTTGNDGVNSVPAALQENTWTKYPLAALIEEFMRGG